MNYLHGTTSKEGNKSENQEDWVNLPRSGKNQGNQILDGCLVEKLWKDKSFNIRPFMNTIRGIWNPRKGVEINELGKKLFIFQSTLHKDKQKVVDNQPWHFDHFLLVLKGVSSNEHPPSIDLAQTPF